MKTLRTIDHWLTVILCLLSVFDVMYLRSTTGVDALLSVLVCLMSLNTLISMHCWISTSDELDTEREESAVFLQRLNMLEQDIFELREDVNGSSVGDAIDELSKKIEAGDDDLK